MVFSRSAIRLLLSLPAPVLAMIYSGPVWAMASAPNGGQYSAASSATSYASSPYYSPMQRWDPGYSQFLDNVQTHSTDARIVEYAAGITRNASSSWAKVVAIHDWVTSNIRFGHIANYQPTNSQSVVAEMQANDALNVLSSGVALCDGYSALTASLLRASGIPAIMVTGTYFPNGDSRQNPTQPSTVIPCDHEWNMAYVDGTWIYLDVTFDATGAGRKFLNPSAQVFAQTHQNCDESAPR